MPRTHRHFPGRYPLSNRYLVNRSRWLLSTLLENYKKVAPRKKEQIFSKTVSVAASVAFTCPRVLITQFPQLTSVITSTPYMQHILSCQLSLVQEYSVITHFPQLTSVILLYQHLTSLHTVSSL